MKPCRKQNIPARRSAPPAQPAPPAVQTPETPVHRYVHPIRTARPAQRSSAEEMLSYIPETLSRQSEQLEELMRRTERDNSDTR